MTKKRQNYEKVFFSIHYQETKLRKKFFSWSETKKKTKIMKKVLGLERCDDTNKTYIEFLD